MKFPLLPLALILAFFAGVLTHYFFGGRYRVITGPGGLIRFDAMSGQTWFIDSQAEGWKLVGEPIK